MQTTILEVCGSSSGSSFLVQGQTHAVNRQSAAPTVKQHAALEAAAIAVLDARKKFPDASLADLYDPLSTPPALVKAHSDLDRAVDLCYRPQPFENDRQRVEHLFALYEKLTAPLIAPTKRGRRKTKRDRQPSHPRIRTPLTAASGLV